MTDWFTLLYIVSGLMFIYGIKRLSKVTTAVSGNMLAALGMTLAVVVTLFEIYASGATIEWVIIIIGIVIGSLIGLFSAYFTQMTAMPQMVALLNGFGGIASLLVGLDAYLYYPGSDMFTVVLSLIIGAVTFTGSLIAYGKLQGFIPSQPIIYSGHHVVNAVIALLIVVAGFFMAVHPLASAALITMSLLLGILLVISIGGADMPVVIALLNSYSGIAAAMAGFAISNLLLIITGALVGASGVILTIIMCRAMNRSIINVLFGGFGQVTKQDASGYTNVKECSVEDAAGILAGAQNVVVVPGYGMAVAQAQGAVRDLTTNLEKRGASVLFAIHPVAGRMPGHMNVLLADADISYEKLRDLDAINDSFKNTDVVIVVGANDVVNPAAIDDKSSPIYGMPILHVHEAKTVIVVKRSLNAGFAGIKNTLFERENTLMLYGDAKDVLARVSHELKEL